MKQVTNDSLDEREYAGTKSASTPLNSRRHLLRLVILSMGCALLAAAFKAGVDGLADGTPDSAGNRTGFNERYTVEHYLMMPDSFSPARFLRNLSLYELLLGTAQGGMILLLARVRNGKWAFRFCLIQPLLFPLGLLGMPGLVLYPLDILFFHTADRETYEDMPFVSMISQGVWLVISAILAWQLRPGRRPLPRAHGS